MIETYPLIPGAELICWRDDRFKQGCLSIQLLRPMDSREAAMNALIPTVLLRGTKKHPDLRSVTMALDDLYGAAISPLVRRVGDCQTTGLYCNFMDARFALPGDKVLEPMVDFLRELLLDYPETEGGFLPDFVESEKKNAISAIEAELNDKRAYAMQQLLQQMCKADTFGQPRLGTPEQIRAITPQALMSHYRRILKESPIRIFYVGSENGEQVAKLMMDFLAGLERSPMTLAPQTDFHSCPGSDETETMEVAQGKLCMGFVTPITNRSPEFAAMQLFNTIYGGGMTSKLFMQVREKQSLCYSVGSNYFGAKGILVASAGIDFDKEAVTRQEILRQLECCKAGDITEEEMQAGKEALLSGLRAAYDSPGAIEGYFSTAALSGLTWTPEEYAREVAKVTREQVAQAAATVALHSTYFLKGENQ